MLKNCPFCGCTASIELKQNSRGKGDWFMFVMCNACGSQTKTVTVTHKSHNDFWDTKPTEQEFEIAEQKVTSMWNIRTK